VQAKYKKEKHEIFPNKLRCLDEEMPELSYFEKSAIEMSAEETMMMLERIASIGYEHNKTGLFQSKENDIIGTQGQKRQAQRNDERRTQDALYETQEKTRQE